MGYPSFNVGDVLTASDMNAVGLWLVKTQTVGTGVTSVEVTNAFSADYENYYITYTNGTASTDTALNFRLGPATAANYNTLYYGGLVGTTTASAVASIGVVNNANVMSAGMGSTDAALCEITVLQPQIARFTGFRLSWIDTRTTFYWAAGAGIHRSATAYTGFFIIPNAGTLTGGTIRVYGYRK